MQVLSEAVPMTNGEVYALMRRRRDERNASLHPPFGLQPVLGDTHTPPQASTQRGGGGGGGAASTIAPSSLSTTMASGAASMASGLAGSLSAHGSHTAGSTHAGSLHSRAVPVEVLDSAAAAAAASTASLLAAPASGHLVVLLTEVTVLNYLANHAALASRAAAAAPGAETPACTSTLRDVYGPTSVYDRGVAEALPMSGAVPSTNPESQPQQQPPHGVSSPLVDAEFVSSRYAALAGHRPGTKGHVQAATELLEAFDEAGKAQERIYAAGVRRVVRQLWRQRLWMPETASPIVSKSTPPVKPESALDNHADGAMAETTGGASADAHDELDAAMLQKKMQNEISAVADANARASVPLLLEPTPLWGAGVSSSSKKAAPSSVADTHASQQQQQARCALLSETEVMQLVVGRPQTALDVYRLLDDIDSRLQYNEEAIAAFVEGITGVFTQEAPAS